MVPGTGGNDSTRPGPRPRRGMRPAPSPHDTRFEEEEVPLPRARNLCGELQDEAEEIAADTIARWKEMARTEPWADLPEDIDHDHLPHVIGSLLEACAQEPMDRVSLRKGVEAAAKHGRHRARQGFDEGLIFREYSVLRKALDDRLARIEPHPRPRAGALVRIDAGITLLSGASLRGLHKDALEASGDWEGLLDRYLQDFRLPEL